jgi:hypothetical protein
MEKELKEELAATEKPENKWDNEEIESWDIFSIKWKQNIVKDNSAPLLYSRQVINIFSILFSLLFGGILLAINLKTVNNKKGILPVILFSLAYSLLTIFIISLIPGHNSSLTLIFNLLGAIVLYNYFWVKYIGARFKYRTKSFWIPLIIGVLLSGLIIWSIIAGPQIQI